MVIRLAVVFAIAALILGPAVAAALTKAALPQARPSTVTVYTVSEAADRVGPTPQTVNRPQRGNGLAKPLHT